ncbi:MAG: substrate-binding domain-containing protein [Ruminiclostridium sp.]
MKKLLSMLLSFVLVITLFSGCGTSTATQSTQKVSADASTVSDSSSAVKDSKPLVIGFLSKLMSSAWEQDMEVSLKAEAKKYGATIITADADKDTPTQLQQLDNMIAQKVDGIVVFIADQKISSALVEKCKNAGIPIIGESIRLIDSNNMVAPSVELDGYKMGGMCAEWVVKYMKDKGITNYSNVGYVSLSNIDVSSIADRSRGSIDTLKSKLPDFPVKQIFQVDAKSTADTGYNSTAATIAAHPEITKWIVVGPNEETAQGATRALEQSGLAKDACVVSMGGEIAKDEFKKDEETCWKAAAYFSAKDCALQVMNGMMQIIKDGKAATDIFTEYKEKGQNYAVIPFAGQMVTRENYKEIMGAEAE